MARGDEEGMAGKRLRLLFIHQNFPGQFKHLAPALAREGHEVLALTLQKVPPSVWNGVRIIPYSVSRGSTPNIHPWLIDFETKVIRGEACMRAMLHLKESGFTPDAIIAHPGWGETLFVKEVWPEVPLGIYCEFFYHIKGADVGFDPEFPIKDPVGEACRLKLKNLNYLLHFEIAKAGIAPTKWQASLFPEPFRSKITVVHDGIDTETLKPNPQASLTIIRPDGKKITLTRSDEIITFVNRNLEPYRGYHIFMRALPKILRLRPKVKVLIVGGDGVSYGAPPDPARYGKRSWKQIFIDEVRPKISDEAWERVYFLGIIPYESFVALLQVSTVHVYLTYPFVLSWSLLEAMSIGCAIVASNTEPVREVICDGETGFLVDFFDVEGLAERVCELLDDPERRARLGKKAREFVVENYDLKRVCLPKQLAWVEELVGM